MRLAVVGTGYVGLVSGTCLAELGHEVICVDRVAAKVEEINGGGSPIHEVGLSELVAKNVHSGRLRATTSLHEALEGSALSLIAVGTPDRDGQIDLRQIQGAATEIGAWLADHEGFHVVVVKSTVVPGTTDTCVREALEAASGKRVGQDFGLCMNPEFLREGAAVRDFMDPDRIVIGAWDERSAELVRELYAKFDCHKLTTTPRTAEMIKYAANSLLATLISYSNEIGRICEESQVDVADVLAGVHLDHRFSPRCEHGERVRPGMLSYLWAGVGYGGSCFPKDVKALYAYAQSKGLEAGILGRAIAVNEGQPLRLVQRARDVAGSFAGQVVAVLGVAFKPETDDVRESPAGPVVAALLAEGAEVRCHDPIARSTAEELLGQHPALSYAASATEAFSGANTVFLITSWSEYTSLEPSALRAAMGGTAPLLVDGRRAFDKAKCEAAGLKYVGVGVSS